MLFIIFVHSEGYCPLEQGGVELQLCQSNPFGTIALHFFLKLFLYAFFYMTS
jgi:hypothetical protein